MSGRDVRAWLYIQGGQQHGPVDLENLAELLVAGRLPRETLVWRKGLAEWTPASRVEEIAAHFPPPMPAVQPQPRYAGRCDNCTLLFPLLFHDAEGGSYCSRACRAWATGPKGFCARCVAETKDETPRDGWISTFGHRVNGVGRTFLGKFKRCEVCGSVISLDTRTVAFMPVWTHGQYRVLWSSPRTFYCRRLKRRVEIDEERDKVEDAET